MVTYPGSAQALLSLPTGSFSANTGCSTNAQCVAGQGVGGTPGAAGSASFGSIGGSAGSADGGGALNGVSQFLQNQIHR